MNIAIFDLQHFEMVHVWHHVFDEPANNISFFTNKKLLDKINKSELRDQPFSTILIDDFINIDDFLENCLNHIENQKIEGIIFNTIDRKYKNLWKFIKKINVPVFVTIHNLNTWLNPPFTFNKRALINYYYRYKILSRTRGIIVQEELFIGGFKKNKFYKKHFFAVPHTLNEREIVRIEDKKLIVAIPGGIDGHRRNYNFCLSVIESIDKNSDIQFVFIGEVKGPLGKKIFSQIKALQASGYDIKYCFDRKSNKVFDEQMSASDIVFLPLNVETKFEGIKETYGISKVTGVLYDMMRFQKPGIVPNELVIPPTMEGSIVKYSSDKDIVEKLIILSADKNMLAQLSQKAKRNSLYYTKMEIKNRFIVDFKHVLDS